MTRVDLEPRYLVGIACVVGLLSAPLLMPILTLRQLTAALFLGMFAMSWDYVSGYTGQLSFGHSMFFGIGGYTAAVLNLELGISPLVGILIGTIAAGIAGLVVGYPALRLEGPYLGLITLIAPIVLVQIVNIFPGTLGGDAGLPSPAGLIPVDDTISVLSAIGFETPFEHQTIVYYYVALFLFLAIYALFYVFTRSYIGSIFTAIHEDEDAVRSAGINVAKFKVFAFTMSGTIGGLAGAAFVHTPVGEPSVGELLYIVVSIEVVIVSILGGMGTITGPAVAGIAYYFIRDALQTSSLTIPLLDVTVGHISMVLFFSLALLVLFFLPRGILPWLEDLSHELAQRRTEQTEPIS
ncbi:branched-chain amino acid ABC transporter permease [Natrarchaeobius sp. A-rgal3]|uniref:branched-chain amino acid ABC transporter permease n=1 Tax=Natrarchaeobius versutus TaxID=1679078 RepID=UPI00350E922D